MTPNVVKLYHSGDLGDVVYAVPALRRLAYPVHLTLYPNPGVTRVVMDEANANRIIPLLNAQPGLSADWKPGYDADGLRIDFGVRRFYRHGYNLADIHSNWVGHDHWQTEHPWFVADKPDYSYPITVNRSERYRNDDFPWKTLYDQFHGRACFVGTPNEHKNFQTLYGKIDYVETPSLLEAARIIAGSDLFIGNQSCPRAIAEALKVPVLVEVGNPNNTHFGREFAWYPALGNDVPTLDAGQLENYWCGAASKRALVLSDHRSELLAELARITRRVRKVPGEVLEVGTGRGGSAAVLGWSLQRTLQLCDHFADGGKEAGIKHLESFLRVYPHAIHTQDFPKGLPEKTKFAFAHIDTDTADILPKVQEWLLPRMSPGGMIVLNGYSMREIEKFAPLLRERTAASPITSFPGLYAFQIGV